MQWLALSIVEFSTAYDGVWTLVLGLKGLGDFGSNWFLCMKVGFLCYHIYIYVAGHKIIAGSFIPGFVYVAESFVYAGYDSGVCMFSRLFDWSIFICFPFGYAV